MRGYIMSESGILKISKKDKGLKVYPFEHANQIIERIEAYMTAQFAENDGKLPQGNLFAEYFSGLHLELSKAPSLNPAVVNRLTREFHASKDLTYAYRNMLAKQVRDVVAEDREVLNITFTDQNSGESMHVLSAPDKNGQFSPVIRLSEDDGDPVKTMADIIPILDYELFDEDKWKNESDKVKFARFQMINTTRMMLRELWLNEIKSDLFKRSLSVSYRNLIEVEGEKSGFFDVTTDSILPKRPYQPNELAAQWKQKNVLFSGNDFDKLIEKLNRFSNNPNVGFVQTLSRRQNSSVKEKLQEEFRDTKVKFLKLLAQNCERELLAKGIPADVIELMRDGRLPAGKGYDIEHMLDRALGGTNDHDNLCLVDRLYNDAAADLTRFQTLSLMPGSLRAIYEPVPKALHEASNRLQRDTKLGLDGYVLADMEKRAIVPLHKRILVSGIREEQPSESEQPVFH